MTVLSLLIFTGWIKSGFYQFYIARKVDYLILLALFYCFNIFFLSQENCDMIGKRKVLSF
jgi:hypothetical protein